MLCIKYIETVEWGIRAPTQNMQKNKKQTLSMSKTVKGISNICCVPQSAWESVLRSLSKVSLIPLGSTQAGSLSAQHCSHALRWRESEPSKCFFLNGHKVPIEIKKAASL